MASFPKEWTGLDVALCHDWLTGMRGGERVLEILCQGFPRAPIHTLIHNVGAISAQINSHPIRTSWMQHIPGVMTRYRYFLPVFPAAIASLSAPPQTRLLISTSHCVAKGLRHAPNTRHLCYCFTPMRYAWTFYEEYFGGSPLRAAMAKVVLPYLRRWDLASSKRVDRFVAISEHVRGRIQQFYERDADVVYPPADTDMWTPGRDGGPRDFDLIVSALVPYKRVDLAIRAYNRLGFPLKVVGAGTGRSELAAMAAPNVEVLGWRPDDQILDLYRNCRLLVFPGEEDFGLVPVEAQACGKPVVAFRKGGAMESILDGVSGTFFDEQTEEALLDAVRRAAGTSWDPAAIRRNAQRFSIDSFIQGLAKSIAACLG